MLLLLPDHSQHYTNLFKLKVLSILQDIEEPQKTEYAGKITIAFEMLFEASKINTNPIQNHGIENTKPESTDPNTTILKKLRNQTGIKRDTYNRVLSNLSQEMKQKKEIIPTTELRNRFKSIIETEIVKMYEKDSSKNKTLAIKGFEAGAHLAIRKATVNDAVRKNLLYSDNNESKSVKKWNLFILCDENGSLIETSDRIEWRNLYIRSYQENTDDKKYLLNLKEAN